MDYQSELNALLAKAKNTIKQGVADGIGLPDDLEENPILLGTVNEDSYYLGPESEIDQSDWTVKGFLFDDSGEYWFTLDELTPSAVALLANHYQGFPV